MENKEEKSVVPKVYALLVESQKNFFLSVQYAYSLEDAFYLARLEFAAQNPPKNGIPNTLDGAKIGLFSIKTVSQLTKDIDKLTPGGNNSTYPLKDPLDEPATMEDIMDIMDSMLPNPPKINKVVIPIPPVTQKEDKNSLMKEIIEKKDIGLFNKVKHTFTPAERKFIKEHLK